ncbi:CLUMA_CG018298, isoform A [Clunio marinus]|uniref:CLUMA_CG018298, isoform A n=1 Tax=Clunio marinus TaxID=568069 RepID=A0A1J1IZ41_9DIPT|nr:CLUMA_CG018298, isoform A [Clunio marinus]
MRLKMIIISPSNNRTLCLDYHTNSIDDFTQKSNKVHFNNIPDNKKEKNPSKIIGFNLENGKQQIRTWERKQFRS